MKRFLFIITFLTFLLPEIKAQVPNKPLNQRSGDTSRNERAKKKYRQLFA